MPNVDPVADLAALGALVHAKVPSSTMFRVLAARIMIQTGVDLDGIREDQLHDRALLERVAAALGRMGIDVGNSPS